MTTARDILQAMKARDALDPKDHPDEQNQGAVVLLSQSQALTRLVACWPNVPVSVDPDPREEVPPDTPRSHHIRWLWSRLEPDPIPVWLATAGLPDAPHFRKWCYVAIDNQMVMPDGGRSRWATRYVTARAADVLA